MRGRFRRLVTVSVARVGSSQPLLFLVSSVLGALLAVLLRTYEVRLPLAIKTNSKLKLSLFHFKKLNIEQFCAPSLDGSDCTCYTGVTC